MALEIAIFLIAGVLVFWLLAYMLSQKSDSSVQRLIQQHRYVDAITEADKLLARDAADTATLLHRAEAAKLAGAFEEALISYGKILKLDDHDAAAREGRALTLAYLRRSLPEAIEQMESTIQNFPAIQEFQALSLAFILLTAGRRDDALRLYGDNVDLLQTRFDIDYTDPDPLLAETLFLYAVLAAEAGDAERAAVLRTRVSEFAPGSSFARWVAEGRK